MGFTARLATAVIGERTVLPARLLAEYPELRIVRWRRGGMLPRLGGWALGRRFVEAITLRRTVFLARHASLEPQLLLHETRHVQQFFESRTFPLRYLLESLRRGYSQNRYEIDARQYASRRVASRERKHPPGTPE